MRGKTFALVVVAGLFGAVAALSQGAPLGSFGAGSGGGAGSFLALDASNDPLTGDLEIDVSGTSRLRIGPTEITPGATDRATITLAKGASAESCLNFINNGTDNDDDDAIAQLCLDSGEEFKIKPERVGSSHLGFSDALGDYVMRISPEVAQVEFLDGTNYASDRYMAIEEGTANGDALITVDNDTTWITNTFVLQETGPGAVMATVTSGETTIAGDLNPSTSATYELGSSSTDKWNSLRLDSNIDCASLPTCAAAQYGRMVVCNLGVGGKDSGFFICLSEAGGGDAWTGVYVQATAWSTP